MIIINPYIEINSNFLMYALIFLRNFTLYSRMASMSILEISQIIANLAASISVIVAVLSLSFQLPIKKND